MKPTRIRPVAFLATAAIVLCGTGARGQEDAARLSAPKSADGTDEAATGAEAPAAGEEEARTALDRLAGLKRASGPPPAPEPLTLEECLDLARRKNLDMLIEENKRRKASLDVAAARAAFLPTFTASYTRDYDLRRDSGSLGITQSTPWGTSLTVTGNHSTDPVDQSATSVSAKLSQELFRGFGPASSRANLSIAERNELAAGEHFERLAQDTVYNVKSQYYDVARLLATVEVRTAAVGRARRLGEEATFKRDRGMITVLDYSNAVIQLADREASLVSSRRRLEDALDNLKELLDIPLVDEVSIEPAAIDMEEKDTPTERTEIVVDREAGTVSIVRTWKGEEGKGGIDRVQVFVPAERDYAALSEEARRSRPDLAAARLELAAKRIELGRKRNQLFNKLTLSGTYTAEGSGDASGDSLDLTDAAWKLSLDYSWPVGRRARRADYDKAALDFETKETEVRKLEVSVEKEVRRIVRSLRETETNILTYAQKISAAARALEAAKIRKEVGQTTYWEVTARESDLLEAQTSFINAYLDYQKRLAELDRATGKKSGWTEGQ